jgi:hypothetical protein
VTSYLTTTQFSSSPGPAEQLIALGTYKEAALCERKRILVGTVEMTDLVHGRSYTPSQYPVSEVDGLHLHLALAILPRNIRMKFVQLYNLAAVNWSRELHIIGEKSKY